MKTTQKITATPKMKITSKNEYNLKNYDNFQYKRAEI